MPLSWPARASSIIPGSSSLGATLTGKSADAQGRRIRIPRRASAPRSPSTLLASGRVVRHRLTIPEGLTSAEVAALLAAAPALDGTVDPLPAEGSLLPETYFYTCSASGVRTSSPA